MTGRDDLADNELRINKASSVKINWALLGGVRFFLAFVVLSEHLGWFVENDPILKFSKFSPLVAVLGFFVISGFSIAASFDAHKSKFYFRRCLRIVPVYVFSIFLSEIVDVIAHANTGFDESVKVDFKSIIGNLFFLQGIFTHSLGSNPIVWTLSIEVLFYIVAPYVSVKNKWVVAFVIFSVFLFVSQRYIGFFYFSQMLYGLGTAFLGWAWLIGYWYYYYREKPGAIYFLTVFGVLAITVNGFFVSDFWTVTWVLTCVALGYGHVVQLPFSAGLKTLGDISYPMYLLHIPVFKLIDSFSTLKTGLGYVAVVACFSFLADRLIDRPIKAYFKNRY